MKKSLKSRLRSGLFPEMPQSFADRLTASLPVKQEQAQSERPAETFSEGQERFKLRFWQTLAFTSLGLLTAACFLFVVIGGFLGRKSDLRDVGTDSAVSTPEVSASPTAVPIASGDPETGKPSVVGVWKLYKVDYNGLILSASAINGARSLTITFREDGTADVLEAYFSKQTVSYTFDGSTVTLSGDGTDDGQTFQYDAEADTLTEQKADGGMKQILRREIKATPTAVGEWKIVKGLDFEERLTVYDDGTASVVGWRSNVELPFTYTVEDGEMQFICTSEMTQRSFTARYDAERDVLSVTMDGSTEEWTRATPELAKTKWTLTGFDYNGTVTDANPMGLQMYLAFSDDETVTMTLFIGAEGDSARMRYLVSGNKIELMAIDPADPLLNSVPISSLTYDPQTDTLRLEYDTETMAYDMALIFSNTPDAEIPEIKPDLVGKWTVTEVQMNGETVDPSMFGEKGGMWLELNPDGSAMLTGLNDVDGIEQGGQYTVTENTVVITDENGDPLTLTYDPATDTLFVEHLYSDYNLTMGLRFARTPDAEIPELPSEELTELKRLYPEYFGLDTTKGLRVYVWQMSGESYSCALVSGAEEKTDVDIGSMPPGISIEEMLLILSTYDVPAEQIEIIPFRNPFSSYWYEIDKAYTQRIVWLLNGTPDPAPYLSELPETGETVYEIDDPEHILNVLTDTVVYDVDGDGRLESCRLSFGPTSGLFTVVFHVYRNGKLVYLNTFNMEFGTLSFVRKNGALLLKSVPQNSTEERFYAVSIESGAVVLTDESTGDTVEYWGTADTTWNMGFPTSAVPEEMLEGLWCALSTDSGEDGLIEIRFYTDGVTGERMAEYSEDGFSYDGYSYTVEKWEQSQRNSDYPWYRFILVDGNEELTIDLCMDMDGRNPLYMDWNVGEDEGGWKTYLKLSPIEADALPYQQTEYYGAGEGFVGYLDIVDLNGDGNPVRVKVASYDPNRFIDKGEEPELTVQIGRGEWMVNEVLVWDSLIYADLDPNDGHGNVLVSAKRADGTVVTYELHLEGDKVVCGHVAEGYCKMYAMSTDIYLCETAPLGGVDGERKISGEALVPESDWRTVPRMMYSSEKDRDWLVQHGQLLHLVRDLTCEIDGKTTVLEAGTYLYLSRYHEGLDRIEFLTEDNRTVLVRPQAGLLLDGAALTDYFEQPAED